MDAPGAWQAADMPPVTSFLPAGVPLSPSPAELGVSVSPNPATPAQGSLTPLWAAACYLRFLCWATCGRDGSSAGEVTNTGPIVPLG